MSSEDLQEKPIKSMGYRIYFSLSSVDWVREGGSLLEQALKKLGWRGPRETA